MKAEIRQLLLGSIGDSERKLRATIVRLPMTHVPTITKSLPPQAYGVAAIAHWDWPEMWPEFLPQLEAALCSGDAHLVHGAMRVLSGKPDLLDIIIQLCVLVLQSSAVMCPTLKCLMLFLSFYLNY